MSENDKESKSAMVLTFNGEDEQYQKWWLRFKGCYKLAGFSKTLKDTPEDDLSNDQDEVDALTGTKVDAQKKKKAVDRNDKSLESFTLAFTNNELLVMLMEFQTDE